MVEFHPELSNCYVKPLPEDMVSMERFASILSKRSVSSFTSFDSQAAPLPAKDQKVVHKTFSAVQEVSLEDIRDLPEAFYQCRNSNIYTVTQVPSSSVTNKTATQAPGGFSNQFKYSLTQLLTRILPSASSMPTACGRHVPMAQTLATGLPMVLVKILFAMT